jgi:chromosomal replication initiator protein
MKLEDVWNESLLAIETEVSKQSFDSWFKPLKLEAIDGDQAYLTIPNRFVGEWLKEHYCQLLERNLQRATKQPGLKIQFVIQETQSYNATAPETDTQEHTQDRLKPPAQLNSRYTFETFVVGASNQFAHAACRAVAEAPARAYNPLFIYGGVGLGKTHLLNAVGHAVCQRRSLTKIAYLSSEQFTNEVINSIRYDKMLEFRNKYRNMDILLVDDIQFIAGKERTQEEFFHTFNTLYEAHKQIVISSDRFPKEMPAIEERLRSRFEWGLIADLQPPDLETKIAILNKKADTDGLHLPNEVALFLAANIKTNIRELEGSLIRLGAFSSLTGHPVTIELAKKVLRDTINERKRFITIEEIQKTVAERFHMKAADMKAKNRAKNVAYPRQIAMHLCRELTDLSFPEIGRHFGGRDHTTVIHACKQVERMKEHEPSVKQLLEGLIQQLKG